MKADEFTFIGLDGAGSKVWRLKDGKVVGGYESAEQAATAERSGMMRFSHELPDYERMFGKVEKP